MKKSHNLLITILFCLFLGGIAFKDCREAELLLYGKFLEFKLFDVLHFYVPFTVFLRRR